MLNKRLQTICVTIVFILLSLFAVAKISSIQAATPWVGNNYGISLNQAWGGGVDSRAGASDFFDSIMRRLACLIAPVAGPQNCGDGEQFLSLVKNSALVKVSGGIVAMYLTPPANTYAFIMDTGQTLGFIPKTAYAQSIGFGGFAGLLPIWKAFRNLAYMILAIVMIVIGFMVMFRKKIDPKTVVTVQNALPKIVVALLLITFSYAIVGLMIDLMYLLIFAAFALFKSTGLLPDTTIGLTNIFIKDPQQLYTQGGIWSNVLNINVDISKILGVSEWGALGAGITGATIAGTIAALVGSATFWPIVAIVLLAAGSIPVILHVIIGITLFFLILKLFVFFLSTYIQIIMALIFAPFQLMFEAIPGSNSFESWMRNLTANILAFPIGAVMFMLSGVFMKLSNLPNANLWTPPYTSVIGPFSSASIAALLSIAVVFAIPTIAAQVKELLKPKPFLAAGPESIVAPLGQAGGIGFQMFQFWWSHHQHKQLQEALGQKQQHSGGGSP